MGYRVVSEPGAEPVTVSECKLTARLSNTALDDLIEMVYIPAARRICEQRTGRSLITQSITKTIDAWPAAGDIRLDFGPVQEINFIHYLDDDGATQTVDTSVYTLDNKDALRPAWVILQDDTCWPSAGDFANAITVEFVAGYGDAADDVPRELRLWVMAAVADMIRSGTPDIKPGFAAGLLDRESVLGM